MNIKYNFEEHECQNGKNLPVMIFESPYEILTDFFISDLQCKCQIKFLEKIDDVMNSNISDYESFGNVFSLKIEKDFTTISDMLCEEEPETVKINTKDFRELVLIWDKKIKNNI